MDRLPALRPIGPAPATAAVRRRTWLAAAAPCVQAVSRTLGLAGQPWPAAELEGRDRERRLWWIELACELQLKLD